MPNLVDILINASNSVSKHGLITGIDRTVILSMAYVALLVVILTDILLLLLLLRVRSGLIFTSASVSLIRGVSWCLLSLGAIFVGLGIFFLLCFAVAFVVVLVGLCLRVVKNVIEQANEIKSENDLTV